MCKTKSNKKPNKIRKILNIVLDIVFIAAGAVALAFSGYLFYKKVYLTPFWVNGQSMYPTFNSKALSPQGNEIGKNGGSSSIGCTKIDYGLMDCHEKALKKLKRFDIVVTYYYKEDTKKKIKRVIGLPGETIKFDCERGEKYGDLYVKQGDEFVLVPQPIENEYKINVTKHPYPTNEIVLGDDEYYLLGDNRNNSSDSREQGKIKFEWLVGKVKALCGYCTLVEGENGSPEADNVEYYKPAWF